MTENRSEDDSATPRSYWNLGVLMIGVGTLIGGIALLAIQNPWKTAIVVTISVGGFVLPYAVGRGTVWAWGVRHG